MLGFHKRNSRMINHVSYSLETPCGFTIWLTPMQNGTMKWRAFFNNEEVGMDYLSEKLTIAGAKMLASKLKEVTSQ